MTDTESIQEGFPHPNVDPIRGNPTYESIADIQRQLNSNCASMHLNLGNGRFGLLMLTVTPNIYLNQAKIAFIARGDSGTTAVVGGGLTTPPNQCHQAHVQGCKYHMAQLDQL